MTTLENIQNKVTLVGQFLFNKQVLLPTTIKECEVKLNNYYRLYGYTYLDVCKITGKELKITL